MPSKRSCRKERGGVAPLGVVSNRKGEETPRGCTLYRSVSKRREPRRRMTILISCRVDNKDRAGANSNPSSYRVEKEGKGGAPLPVSKRRRGTGKHPCCVEKKGRGGVWASLYCSRGHKRSKRRREEGLSLLVLWKGEKGFGPPRIASHRKERPPHVVSKMTKEGIAPPRIAVCCVETRKERGLHRHVVSCQRKETDTLPNIVNKDRKSVV